MTARVFRDRWGVPHLRADDPAELAFAQGRVTGHDRAWQIEVERHRSLGTSAAFLGADAVPWDRFARRTRLDDTARRCHARLDAATAAWVGRYVDGVNAGLADGAARDPRFGAVALPPGRWEPWTPLAIWLTHHVLFAGFPGKLWREHVARRLGPAAVPLFHADGPASSGSNGWLLAGSRTATGAALLAGDPHRYIEDPGIYQQIRLACPEYDVVGLAVPGVPGIAHFGHTGAVAWAITNAMADYQDLYAERLRRHGGGVEAYGPDGWRPARTHTEPIEVAGGDPVEVEVVETDRGPVVVGGPDSSEAISLRYPSRATGELGFAALPALLRARTVADVDAAVDRWVEPVNVVLAADTAGGLLHRVAGAVPDRHTDNRLGVVPAWAPAYAWRGWHPMPRADVRDVAVMANECGVSAPLGVEFAPPHRARRIRELLDASSGWSAGRMGEVHTDTYLAPAEPLLALLADLADLPPEAATLRDRLLRWDRRMAAASGDAGAFAALRSALVRRIATHPALAALAEPPAYPEVFAPWLAVSPRVAIALNTLLVPGALPGLDASALTRDALLEVAGSDQDPAVGGTGARWGARHRLAPWRALPDPGPGDPPSDADTGPDAETGPELPVGPDRGAAGGPELDGDHDCVLATSSVPGFTDLCLRGPAARYAWDLARREDSRWVVPLGADGVPGTAHHDDQLAAWRRGELLAVVTDWAELTEERGTDEGRD
ncbi:penicillin acylase family protein [Micromonospora sp. WMMA1363]|uniref:penicillin acylase family protein n=1 Tax=Micromonospora sp. WMMA1363 TaxID=3053985 RepID=UPI00259C8A34|nr:penicillin acylase family protein [Micromonospora sp. WMMA1363]MDM4719227.1 penicillin acylase family protein [Micromonospora sp. WMMA1363]